MTIREGKTLPNTLPKYDINFGKQSLPRAYASVSGRGAFWRDNYFIRN